jgi:hypothetical protein
VQGVCCETRAGVPRVRGASLVRLDELDVSRRRTSLTDLSGGFEVIIGSEGESASPSSEISMTSGGGCVRRRFFGRAPSQLETEGRWPRSIRKAAASSALHCSKAAVMASREASHLAASLASIASEGIDDFRCSVRNLDLAAVSACPTTTGELTLLLVTPC